MRLSQAEARRLGLDEPQRKYKNEKVTIDGHLFDSKREASYYCTLKLRQRAGEIAEIKLQPTYELQPGFRHRGKRILPINYTADFEIICPDGRRQVIDVKGVRTQQYLLRKKMLLYKYPDIEFIEVH